MKKTDTTNMTAKQRREYEEKLRMRKFVTVAVAAVCVFILVVALVYFIPKWVSSHKTAGAAKSPVQTSEVSANADYAREDDPIVTITMENSDEIVVELYPAAAPNTVANFVELASSGFYDGLTFHRVISGFMIQGGDPKGDGTGGPGYSIPGEFSGNGFDNGLKHTRGVISMARANDPDSAGSQFFIMHADASHLDGQYAAFGEVISGMDAVDAIASVDTDSNDKPLTDVVIKSITVDTKGVEYAAEKIDQ